MYVEVGDVVCVCGVEYLEFWVYCGGGDDCVGYVEVFVLDYFVIVFGFGNC